MVTIASAGPTPQQQAEVAAIWETMRAEQRVFFTCSALDPELVELLSRGHVTDVERAADLMRGAGFAEDVVAREVAASQVDALRMPDDTSFGEARALCAAMPDWQQRLRFLSFMLIAEAVEAALSE